MYTRISEEQFKEMFNNNKFAKSTIHECHAEIKGKKIRFEKKCYHSIQKDLFRHFTPEQITEVFPKFKTKHTPTYREYADLGIWCYTKTANETIKQIYKFIKTKIIKFIIHFTFNDDKKLMYCPINIEEEFYDCRNSTLSVTAPSWTPTNQLHDINNEGFEETKGEEATQEADLNEQQNNGVFDKNTLIRGWKDWANEKGDKKVSYNSYYKKVLPSSARSKNGWKNLLNIYINDIVNERKNITDKKKDKKKNKQLSNNTSYLKDLITYLDTL